MAVATIALVAAPPPVGACTRGRCRRGGSSAAQVVFFVYLDDFLYYWFHRGMHGRWLYKHVHGWHHRIVTPWAITGHYMHPVEYSLTGTVALIGPLLLGSHVVTLWVWFAFRQWEAAEGHCRLRVSRGRRRTSSPATTARATTTSTTRANAGTTPGFFPNLGPRLRHVREGVR
jgi:sterol desaturase/sphingolipid hydroxylase (fatty acid hydroxylase superfamily)